MDDTLVDDLEALSRLVVGTPEWREIAERIRNSAGASISTTEIRERVLDELGRANPQWRENWEVYDRAVKHRA